MTFKLARRKRVLTRGFAHRGILVNAFCATGEGGGVDPSCSPGSGGLSGGDVDKLSEWRENLWNRGTVTRLAKQTVTGGKLEHLHPGEIEVYRGRPPGSKSVSAVKGLSYTRSRDVAEKWAEGGKVETLKLTKDMPALDVSKALKGIPSKSEHEQEVFVVRNESMPSAWRPVINARSRTGRRKMSRKPSRIDPTRSITLRRAFASKLRRQFALLKGRIVKLVVDEDAFGLSGRTSLQTLNQDYASTQLPIDDEAISLHLDALRDQIDEEDVLKRDIEPHVTVRYGLDDKDLQRASRLVGGRGPIMLRFGKLSVFSLPDKDVLKYEVDAPHLRALNRWLVNLPHVDAHPQYVPHMTVAYLKPGTGVKWLGLLQPALRGREYLATKLEFSTAERELHEISLNSFCPTGEGGGVDPSCSPGGSVASVVEARIRATPKGASILLKDLKSDLKRVVLAEKKLADGQTVSIAEKQLLSKYGASRQPIESPSMGRDHSSRAAASVDREQVESHSRWARQLSGEEQDAIDSYVVGDGYRDVNAALREGKIVSDVALLDKALSKASLKEDTVLYRGLRHDPGNLLVGETYDEPGYMSTSMRVESAAEWMNQHAGTDKLIMKLTVPKGYNAAYVNAVIGDDENRENEMLLARGSRYKITGVSRDANGLRMVEAMVVNAFCPTGEGGGIDPSCSPGNSGGVVGSLKSLGIKAQHLEHTAKEYIKDKISASVNKLPPAMRKGVIASYHVARAGTSAAFSGWTASQALAERVSIERGATPDQARTLRGVLSAMDMVAFKPASIAMASSGVGALPMAASWIVPPVTGSYLAYSTARDPAATWRAAKGLVKETIGRGLDYATDRILGNARANEIADLYYDALESHGWDDWYVALLLTAMEETGDLDQAIEVADAAYRKSPIENAFAANANYRFPTDPEKLRAFQAWLRRQYATVLSGATERDLWDKYINDGFGKGAARSYDDYMASRPELRREKPDFYRGSRAGFLKDSFRQPETVEKVQLLAGRAFDELEDVTREMSNKMSRVLASGLTEGRHPMDVARDLNRQVDLGHARSETIARTEFMRAHAEGQLNALEELGVEELGVMVEWATAQDEAVCQLCADMEGAIFDIKDAHGMLPRHPNCRCAFIPAGVGEDTSGQKDGKGMRAVVRAGAKGKGDEEEDDDLTDNRRITHRPVDNALVGYERALNAATLNAFCPTGEGGGVDPSCSPGGDGGSKFVGEIVGKAEHEHAANLEKSLAKAVGGKWEENNEFYDVKIGGEHYVEVKSMLKGSKTAISVHPDALLRKVDGIKKVGGTFHTVVYDERGTYGGGAYKDSYSGNRIYYKRGSGRYSLSQMAVVKNEKELKNLIKAPDAQLPKEARGSLPGRNEIKALREKAKQAHESRLRKDRERKARLKAEGKSAYERQT